MKRSKQSKGNRAAAAKNRAGRRKRRERAAPPDAWEKKQAAERVAKIVEGIDPKVKPSTWLPTEGRLIAEASATRLARIVAHEDRDEDAVEAVVKDQTAKRDA